MSAILFSPSNRCRSIGLCPSAVSRSARNTLPSLAATSGYGERLNGCSEATSVSARFVAMAIDTFDDLHIIVNNAGYTWDAVIQKMTEEQFDAMIDVHLKAPWRILKEAAEFIRVKSKQEAQEDQRIVRKVVNISSISGTRGNAGQTNYSSAKAAVVGLSKTLAKEWGRYNVAVNSVAFGLIETRLTEATDEKKIIEIEGKEIPVGVPVQNIAASKMMIPMGRGGTPKEAAGAVVALCLPYTDYISGQLIEVTGGL